MIDFQFFRDIATKIIGKIDLSESKPASFTFLWFTWLHQIQQRWKHLLTMQKRKNTALRTWVLRVHMQPALAYLYHRINLLVSWNSAGFSDRFYLRLSGMDFLMTYIGNIGSLMAGTSASEVLVKVFERVPKMLTGKKYSHCVSALRLLVKNFLCPILQDKRITSDDMPQEYSTEKSEKSRATQRWVSVLINSLFLVFFNLCTYKFSFSCISIHTCQARKWLASPLPCFWIYAASDPCSDHHNYTGNGFYYLKGM